MKIDTWHTVEAPEGVELGLRIAGPFPRALAWLCDLGIRWLIYFGIGSVLVMLGNLGIGILLVSMFLLEWGWGIYFEVFHRGATPGKRLMGLKVVCDDGTPVGWTESLLRNVTRPADMLPFGYALGLVSCMVGPGFKRLGDRAAGTLVVHNDAGAQLPIDDKLKATPLRPPVSLDLEEQGALVDFALRSGIWTGERRVELANHLSVLTEAEGAEGVTRLHGMARWMRGAR